MNPRLAIDVAAQRQAHLRGERVAPRPRRSPTLPPWREAPAAMARARRRTGWALVEVGLRLAVHADGDGEGGLRA